MGKAFTGYQIGDRSFVSYVKREIHVEALRAGFSEVKVGHIDIIVSEMCSNIVKHAGSGEILYRVSELKNKEPFCEVICIDKGPGMADPVRMMRDGVSTAGTLGHGLGAIDRLSNFSQFYSMHGSGTIIYAKVCNSNAHPVSGKKKIGVEVRALCVNKPRETVCGDGYRVKSNAWYTSLFFGDGLGHGEHAKKAVDAAGDCFMATAESDPVTMIRTIHEHVRRTRGLVATVAILDKRSMRWRICGIGNIITRVYRGLEVKNYMPYNGTIGLNIPGSITASEIPVEKNQHIVMCSDGIRSRWNLSQYPSIFKYDNTILAAAIYRDYNRGNDDSSVLIGKIVHA